MNELPDLTRLTGAEKDALIYELFAHVGVGVKVVQIGRSETGAFSGKGIASRLTVRVITAGQLSP